MLYYLITTPPPKENFEDKPPAPPNKSPKRSATKPVRERTCKLQQHARPHPMSSHLGPEKEGQKPTHPKRKPYRSATTSLSGGAPANPSSAPAHSPRGTASPAMVLRMGVKMMDARIRNAPFAIVVSCSPYTCGEPSKPCYPSIPNACPRLPLLHDVRSLARMHHSITAGHMKYPAKSTRIL